jgi:hypothetical protein
MNIDETLLIWLWINFINQLSCSKNSSYMGQDMSATRKLLISLKFYYGMSAMCSNLFTQSGFDFIFRRCFCLVSENCIGGVMVQVLGCSRTCVRALVGSSHGSGARLGCSRSCVRALVGSIQRLIKFVFAASPLHTALINKNKDWFILHQ